jgi:hypothetical protein
VNYLRAFSDILVHGFNSVKLPNRSSDVCGGVVLILPLFLQVSHSGQTRRSALDSGGISVSFKLLDGNPKNSALHSKSGLKCSIGPDISSIIRFPHMQQDYRNIVQYNTPHQPASYVCPMHPLGGVELQTLSAYANGLTCSHRPSSFFVVENFCSFHIPFVMPPLYVKHCI